VLKENKTKKWEVLVLVLEVQVVPMVHSSLVCHPRYQEDQVNNHPPPWVP